MFHPVECKYINVTLGDIGGTVTQSTICVHQTLLYHTMRIPNIDGIEWKVVWKHVGTKHSWIVGKDHHTKMH